MTAKLRVDLHLSRARRIVAAKGLLLAPLLISLLACTGFADLGPDPNGPKAPLAAYRANTYCAYQSADSKVVSGVVVDATSRHPIDAVTLIAHLDGDLIIARPTNSDGMFMLDPGPSATASALEVHKPGYTTKTLDLRNKSSRDRCGLTIELTPFSSNDPEAR